ncbi:type I restriction enzyme HsdR N-terminal domain-containing protein [Crocinitomicaceae bacterium]|nr:type I restriction enzyme HsdR N-terminal domain-containing protein [Crocinitomicaceae bacterium]
MSTNTLITRQLKKALNAFDVSSAVNSSDNEAKTRMYLVEPFFEILGYNRGFENGNLVPEYDADFANLKGKKVDYAIQFRKRPEIIIEVKKSSLQLTGKHLSQLNEYFNNTNESKIGILTNGVEYQFYCRNQNKGTGLHPTPFYTFNFENVEGSSIEQLTDFYATLIEINNITADAQELFFIEGFEEALFKELANPSEKFIKAISTNMGESRLSNSSEEQIRALINSVSLKSAVERLTIEESLNANSGVITTEEEIKTYHVIKTILASHGKIEASSIGYRDVKTKFSILIDDNQKKKICDLFIKPTSKRIEIDGTKYEITDIESIVKLKKQLQSKALSIM